MSGCRPLLIKRGNKKTPREVATVGIQNLQTLSSCLSWLESLLRFKKKKGGVGGRRGKKRERKKKGGGKQSCENQRFSKLYRCFLVPHIMRITFKLFPFLISAGNRKCIGYSVKQKQRDQKIN